PLPAGERTTPGPSGRPGRGGASPARGSPSGPRAAPVRPLHRARAASAPRPHAPRTDRCPDRPARPGSRGAGAARRARAALRGERSSAGAVRGHGPPVGDLDGADLLPRGGFPEPNPVRGSDGQEPVVGREGKDGGTGDGQFRQLPSRGQVANAEVVVFPLKAVP